MKKLLLIFLSFYFLYSTPIFAQDDLLDILDSEVVEEPEIVTATFKSTRIINGHSIERMVKRQLDFRINHRFGQLNEGAYSIFGLDNALINFSFDYGINDWLMIGIRRGTNKKVYDACLKFSLLRQIRGVKVMPIALSYYTDWSLKTLRGLYDLPDMHNAKWNEITPRFAYTHQLLIARKFNEKFSLQISPTYVHRNLANKGEKNDIFAFGFGGRYKFIRRVALTWEVFYTNHVTKDNAYQYPLALGFDIETGGHVFQLFFTNSRAMVEDGFIGETTSNWLDGGIFFGFNMSRVFAVGIGKHKE